MCTQVSINICAYACISVGVGIVYCPVLHRRIKCTHVCIALCIAVLCVCMCEICLYEHSNVHSYKYTGIQVYICVCTYVRVYTCMCTCMYVCSMYACMQRCIDVFMYMCFLFLHIWKSRFICISCVRACIHTCVCMFENICTQKRCEYALTCIMLRVDMCIQIKL